MDTIADMRGVFQWLRAHWVASGVTGTSLLTGMKAVPMGIRYIYARALVRFDEAKERVRRVRQHTTAATSFQVTEEEVIQWTRFPCDRWRWPWLVRRALRWQQTKKKFA